MFLEQQIIKFDYITTYYNNSHRKYYIQYIHTIVLFLLYFDQINAALVNISDFFQNIKSSFEWLCHIIVNILKMYDFKDILC